MKVSLGLEAILRAVTTATCISAKESGRVIFAAERVQDDRHRLYRSAIPPPPVEPFIGESEA